MRFQTTKNELLFNLTLASRAVSQKTQIPVLDGVLLEVENYLSIYTTDLETSIKTTCGVKVMERGKVVVPIKILLNILKNFPESKIELWLLKDKNQLKITCQNSSFTLNTFPIEEYPQFPEIKAKKTFTYSLEKLKKLISKTIISAAIDENRPVLTGVLMEIGKDSINMCATDSYRLSLVKSNINYDGVFLKSIIPNKVLDNVLKIDFNKKDVDVFIEENQISFNIKNRQNNNITIISRVLSGNFPEYKNLIPKSFKHNLIINKNKLLEVVRRISSISQDNIPIKLKIEKGRMVVSMSVKEIGSSSEDLEIGYGKDKIEIAFNPDFLIDGINIIDDEKITLCIEDPLKPALIKQQKNDDLIYLLMPIKISQ